MQRLTTARSSDSANAFDDETSKLRPTAAAVRSKGSSISLVGLGWRLHTESMLIRKHWLAQFDNSNDIILPQPLKLVPIY